MHAEASSLKRVWLSFLEHVGSTGQRFVFVFRVCGLAPTPTHHSHGPFFLIWGRHLEHLVQRYCTFDTFGLECEQRPFGKRTRSDAELGSVTEHACCIWGFSGALDYLIAKVDTALAPAFTLCQVLAGQSGTSQPANHEVYSHMALSSERSWYTQPSCFGSFSISITVLHMCVPLIRVFARQQQGEARLQYLGAIAQ